MTRLSDSGRLMPNTPHGETDEGRWRTFSRDDCVERCPEVPNLRSSEFLLLNLKPAGLLDDALSSSILHPPLRRPRRPSGLSVVRAGEGRVGQLKWGGIRWLREPRAHIHEAIEGRRGPPPILIGHAVCCSTAALVLKRE